jgi:hypothetical protein
MRDSGIVFKNSSKREDDRMSVWICIREKVCVYRLC